MKLATELLLALCLAGCRERPVPAAHPWFRTYVCDVVFPGDDRAGSQDPCTIVPHGTPTEDRFLLLIDVPGCRLRGEIALKKHTFEMVGTMNGSPVTLGFAEDPTGAYTWLRMPSEQLAGDGLAPAAPAPPPQAISLEFTPPPPLQWSTGVD